MRNRNKRHPPLNNTKRKTKRRKKIRLRVLRPHTQIVLLSSLLFITNVFTALYKCDFIYAALFALLTSTSIAFHSKNYRAFTFLMDKFAIYSIVFYGGYSLYCLSWAHSYYGYVGRIYIIATISTFVFCIWVFYYGYMTKSLCYHPNKLTGNSYHALLHLIGSIGHHMIILGKN